MIGLTAAIAIGGPVSAVIFGYQLHEMRIAGDLTRESVGISRDTLVATQRPWLSVTLEIAGPLQFTANGANIKIKSSIENHGHTPALNARLFIDIDATMTGPFKKQNDLCERQRSRTTKMFGESIFPGQVTRDIKVVQLDRAEIAAVPNGLLDPSIVGCVDYVFAFEEGHHQTGFIFQLTRTPLNGLIAFNPKDGDVDPSDLFLENVFGGHYAD